MSSARFDIPASRPRSGTRAAYPIGPEYLPDWRIEDGRYACGFARTTDELGRIQRLRYEVFNLELGEGLDESHLTGLDRDRFDDQCHHLMVIDLEDDRTIGTYRLQVAQMASIGQGFYTAQEFDLSGWPADVIEQAVEIGRACVHREHRHSVVLQLLWKGLAAYALHNRRRYFFGCSSLTSQDPAEGARVLEYLRRNGHSHPTLDARPHPDYHLREDEASSAGWEDVMIPKLFRAYLRYGARICGRPALDRDFKTIDFLSLIDLAEIDITKVLRLTDVDLGQSS